MKNLKSFALAAISLLGFAACQQVEISPEVKPEATHTVTFVAGAPETKTTVNIDGTTAKFKWTADDINRITLYENGVPATETKGALTDGLMTIKATFDGSATEGENTYIAVVNSSNDLQIMYGEAYDESTDILVSKAVSSFDGVNGVQLQFRREVAIAKMTLKGLDANEEINSITVSSNATIANKYTVNGWSKEETDAKTELKVVSEYSMGEEAGHKITANTSGEAVVWFTCIPQDGATLTVKVEAADGDTYTKEFSRAITLSQGDVTTFGVAMTKEAVVTPSYTIVFLNSTAGQGTSLSATTKASTVIEDGLDYVLSQPFSSVTACYYGGNQPLRVGKANNPAAGSVVIGLSEAGQVPATRIILSAKQYSSGKTQVIGVNGSDKQQPGNDYTDLSYDLDGSDISSIKLDTDGYIYVKSITVEYGETIKTKLATPTNVAVSEAKVVSWDAVDGAASYILTIGSDEFPCETNSYDAKDIADEYYDVAVVAVPSDTENYKNSDAATLTDAKFGTPTLATPTLKEGAVDEFSVNATWTVDPRATEGYNCELYNGDNKVGESKTVKTGSVTFDRLDDGVTYTLKVNALAVDGTKAYAASAVASIELTTEGTSKISDITSTGTYTVKNAVVLAVITDNNAIIGDETGMMKLYNSAGHGLKLGQTITVGGSVTSYSNCFQFSAPTISNIVDGSTPSYGEADTMDKAYLTSYVSGTAAPKYVQFSGAQQTSNTEIKVGDKTITLSASQASTNGKYVRGTGFLYGWFKSTIYFYVVSIEEDKTVPQLSVSPTSKTWESDEVDEVTFTVTTNTEGVKDWTTTEKNLGWATVKVDKAKGTITVTPNGTNEEETANKGTITVTHADDNTLTETITLTQKAAGSTGEKTETIDFESAADSYSFWTFTNMTSQQTGSITAHGGTNYGTTGGKTTASITTNSTIASPKSITFFVSKESKNTTSSSWKIQVSSDNKAWTDVKTQSATSMSKGSWVEVTQDLSSYSNVYVRVYYDGTTAVRSIDDLTFTYSN